MSMYPRTSWETQLFDACELRCSSWPHNELLHGCRELCCVAFEDELQTCGFAGRPCLQLCGVGFGLMMHCRSTSRPNAPPQLMRRRKASSPDSGACPAFRANCSHRQAQALTKLLSEGERVSTGRNMWSFSLMPNLSTTHACRQCERVSHRQRVVDRVAGVWQVPHAAAK